MSSIHRHVSVSPSGPHGTSPGVASVRMRHSHVRDHLTHAGVPRCGCGPEALTPVPNHGVLACNSDAAWKPVRHQHIGFVLTHFIYSDRMADTLQ